jgi:hypothetical protein
VLNFVVTNGLKKHHDFIVAVRNAIRFVGYSPQISAKFKECVEFYRITCKKPLCLDVHTRWNSTYLMLEAAEKYQKAFNKLEGEDYGYLGWCREFGPSSNLDCDDVCAFVSFFKIFYDATKVFASSQQVSLHAAFHQLISTVIELNEACMNLNTIMADVRIDMKVK